LRYGVYVEEIGREIPYLNFDLWDLIVKLNRGETSQSSTLGEFHKAERYVLQNDGRKLWTVKSKAKEATN
jgi:hypothetical protein